MHRRHHGNQRRAWVEMHNRFAQASDVGEFFGENIGGEVGEIEEDMIGLWASTTTGTDFLNDGARNYIAAREFHAMWRVVSQKTLTQRIAQIAAFAAGAFGNQNARTGEAGGVELDEFHILQRKARAQDHGVAVAGAEVGGGGAGIGLAVAAGGEDGEGGFEDVQVAGGDF